MAFASQAIVWANAGLFFYETQGNIFQWNHIWKSKVFIPENAFENICNMSANLSGPKCVDGPGITVFYCLPKPSSVPVVVYEGDLKQSQAPIAKVFMPSVTHCWLWNHHCLYHRQRWIYVSSFPDHQTKVSCSWFFNLFVHYAAQYPSTFRVASMEAVSYDLSRGLQTCIFYCVTYLFVQCVSIVL